jgi:phenylacetate-CoA ligase
MSRKYWDEKLETLPVERRLVLREHRLRWQVRRCWDGSPFYRARLEAAGLDPDTFGGVAEWPRFPILRSHNLPVGDSTGGTSTDWTVAPQSWWDHSMTRAAQWQRVLTDGDEIHRADLAARALWAAGGPLRLISDAESARLHSAIDAGAQRIGTTIQPDAPNVVSWGTMWPPTRGQSARTLGALALPFVAPTIAYACGESEGVHWADDHFLIEIVKPETGELVERGGPGAVAITDLTREGSPLLRFSTGVEAVLIDDPCACGRTSARSPYVRPLT